ncbi:hypothetical protein D3C87_2085510 [compost metagenome]
MAIRAGGKQLHGQLQDGDGLFRLLARQQAVAPGIQVVFGRVGQRMLAADGRQLSAQSIEAGLGRILAQQLRGARSAALLAQGR